MSSYRLVSLLGIGPLINHTETSHADVTIQYLLFDGSAQLAVFKMMLIATFRKSRNCTIHRSCSCRRAFSSSKPDFRKHFMIEGLQKNKIISRSFLITYHYETFQKAVLVKNWFIQVRIFSYY